MKKKVFIGIGSICLILVAAAAIAWPFLRPIKVTWSSLPYEYTIHGTYIEINRYTGDEEEVIIPDRICFRPVKILGYQLADNYYGSFYGNEKIKSVYIPDSVKIVKNRSFGCCKNLEQVRLPNHLRVIERQTFTFCEALKNIELPDGVIEIERLSFSHCYNLENLKLPETIKKIESAAFYECQNLSIIEIPIGIEEIGGDTFAGTAWIDKQQEEYVVAGKNVLICYQGNSSVVEVPEGVEYIGYNVFEHRPELIHLVLPESLKKCDSCMAFFCENLKYITIKNPDMEIPYDPFYGTAFETCNPDLTLVGEKGSTAEAYAEKYGYTFLESIPEE